MDTKLFVRRGKGGMFAVLDRSFVPGSVKWVDSTNTTNGADTAGKGKNPDFPFLTLDYAIGQCTANKGDVIMVMPAHAETLAADVTFDVEGVTVVCLGVGDNRATFTFGAAAREFNTTADNIKIVGARFVSDVNDLVNFIDADANHLYLEDCDFITSSTKEALCAINLATTKDYLTLKNCRAYQPTDPEGTGAAAGTGFIYCVDSEHITLDGCTIDGQWETAIVHNKTTKCQDLQVKNCSLTQSLSGAVPFILVADATGSIRNTVTHVPGATDVAVANIVGTIGSKFWCALDASFSNDSAAGGQLMVVGDSATS